MTIYTLRDKNGVAKMTLPATIACNLIARGGEWKNARYKRGMRSKFIIGSDTAYVITQGGEILTLYVWKGDNIVVD